MTEFRCKLCSFRETFCDESVPFICPKCNSKCYVLTYLREVQPKKEFVNVAYNDSPRLSWALGCNESQLPEMQKKHPGAEFIQREGGGYQMLIKNRTEKKLRMKQAGMDD